MNKLKIVLINVLVLKTLNYAKNVKNIIFAVNVNFTS